MFLPHGYNKETGKITTLEDGVGMSRYYQTLQELSFDAEDQKTDSYDRFFAMARHEYGQGRFSEETEDQIILSTMTKDERMIGLVKKYFRPKDYFLIRSRMVGSGAIGGKACGMLLSRRIAETEIPEFVEHNEPHDSFYIGSDVFYTYIVSNGDWKLRIRQRTDDGYFSLAEEFKEHLLTGTFPDNIREQFLNVIEYFGQSPFIVRSSSFLEDGFGNAFAGKYESVFCVNQGSPEERMNEFEQAVRIVYASTMDKSALEYRRQRGLDKRDEQMAILVQRVSGSYFDNYFMPDAAGVGYSHSSYKWYPDMQSDAGMLRLVMGLGTKAVDRTKEDYPRLASLDRPTATVNNTVAKKHRYSQRYLDVLNCEKNCIEEISMSDILPKMPMWYKNMVLEHDYEAESSLRQQGNRRDVWFISCEGLLRKKEFTGLMQKILKTLEKVYGSYVDIEYAINMDSEGEFVINLLQCRPLYQNSSGENVDIKNLKLESRFFDIKDSSMGSSGKRKIDIVVQIDPVLYYEYPYAKKHDVAVAVGQINRYFGKRGKSLLLMTPGRIGTSSPELGVPVCFADISNFSVICEVSEDRVGYRPELSYGSHMFQDLVEAEIAYGAIYKNAKTLEYNEDFPADTEDIFDSICPDFPELSGMIKVRKTDGLYYYLDVVGNRAVCGRRNCAR
jgi:hypothetical protein